MRGTPIWYGRTSLPSRLPARTGARPQGNLPDRYGESGEDDEAPLCEQHPPAVGTTGSTRIAVGVFPTVAEGTGTTADTSTYELVALDTQTGEAAWNAPLGISVGGDFCHVAGISGGVAVVVLGGSFGPPNTYGVDLQSGKVVWTAEQFEAQSVQGAHVVGVDSSGDGGVVVALDPVTGRTQWRAVDASASAEFEVTRFSAESVLVRNRDYSELSTVLRLKDGQQVDVVGMGERLHEVRRCLYDLQTRTLCFSYTTAGGELAAYEAKSGKLLWRLGGPDGVPGRGRPGPGGCLPRCRVRERPARRRYGRAHRSGRRDRRRPGAQPGGRPEPGERVRGTDRRA